MLKNPRSINIDLRHAILMLARALDYVGVDDFNHGHRVGYIAYECAKRLNWAESRQEFVYFAGLLHDCGVSSIKEHKTLLSGMEPVGAEAHCIRGYEYIKECLVLRPFAEAVRYHHTRWDKLKGLNLPQPERDAAALIFLADRVDVLRATYISDHHPDTVVLHETAISDAIKKGSGSLFHPDFAAAMAELVLVDGFWYNMDQAFIEDVCLSFGADGSYDMPLSVSETINLATFMSRIVDAKSPFTHEHSERVALVAKELASDFGFDQFDQEEVLIAGLLHDVGKLRVPDAMLHKTGKLDDAEMAVMKRHVVDTKLALQRSFPNSNIPTWAANHHEKLDGTGYPYRLNADQLDIQSRIIAVADIFQALSQERPYRERLSFKEIDQIMKPMTDSGKLDPAVYGKLRERADDYYKLATRRKMQIFDDFVDAHIRWREDLKRQKGAASLDPEKLGDHHACMLGQWFDNVGKNRFARLAAFKRANVAHQKFHVAVRQSIVETGAIGSEAEFEELVKALRALAEVIPVIDRQHECEPTFEVARKHIRNRQPKLAQCVLSGMPCDRCTRNYVCADLTACQSQIQTMLPTAQSVN